MDACLDTLTTELYRLRGFATSPSFSPSLEAFKDEDADDGTAMMLRMWMLALPMMMRRPLSDLPFVIRDKNGE